MVARKNVKPDIGDTLRRLVNRTDASATTPHGLKVAEPGEGTTYHMADGGTLFMDGAKFLEIQSTLDSAQLQLEESQTTVDAVQSDLNQVELDLSTLSGDYTDFVNGNLAVNGTLAAQVVQAMDVQTKNLVVTEDAILNRATVIEGIVTSELVAQRIVISDLGYDLMQQAALTVTGPQGTVELSGSGYKAWNAQNQLTVDLNGSANLLTGDIQTAPAGTRALISTRSSTSAIDFFVGAAADHGGLWYDGDTKKTMTLGVMPDAGFDPVTSASLRFDLNARAMRVDAAMGLSSRQTHGYFQWNAPGIPANGKSGEVEVIYSGFVPGAGKPYVTFTPEFSSGANITVINTMSGTDRMKFIVHNNSNFASGFGYVWWRAEVREKYW